MPLPDVSGKPIRPIDCIDKINTEGPRGCKGRQSLYTRGGCRGGTEPLNDTMTCIDLLIGGLGKERPYYVS
jgi:hypothetical protein